MHNLFRRGTWLLLLSLGCTNETRITEVEPPHGTFAGGDEVVIRGTGFNPGHGGVTVKFGKKDATNIVVESDKAIRVTSPAGERNTQVDITVIFDDGRAYLLRNAFRYLDASDQTKVMKNFYEKKK
ncbi:MAG: IPT/TIG domain-containing protein [Myxococcales bacterium]|nr:IPT/TIG domain-containing protein [Myxococcota bacterium]MDW8284131.1 IPT/TIG domain-containing protein [Myxococcales bacterium]